MRSSRVKWAGLFQKQSKDFNSAIDEYIVNMRYVLNLQSTHLAEIDDRDSIILRVSSTEYNDQHVMGIRFMRKNNLSHNWRCGEHIALYERQGDETLDDRIIVRGIVIKLDETIITIKFADKIQFKLSTSSDSLKYTDYELKFAQCPVNKRHFQVRRALNRFIDRKCSQPLHSCLLGSYSDLLNIKYNKVKILNIDGLVEPKGNQRLAIAQSLRKRINLIHGQPGTGKTLVAAHIACSMSRLRKRKILICSPTQSGVDRLAELIDQADGVNVIKLNCNKSIQTVTSEKPGYNFKVKPERSSVMLDRVVDRQIYQKSWLRARRILNTECSRFLDTHSNNSVRIASPFFRNRIKKQVMSISDVICCTVDQIADGQLKGVAIDVLIIDDSHLLSELDCLVAMMLKQVKQVTLLADMSVCGSATASFTNEQLTESMSLVSTTSSKLDKACRPGGLLERLQSIGLTFVILNQQFRMHDKLTSLVGGLDVGLKTIHTCPLTNKILERQIHADFALCENRSIPFAKREFWTYMHARKGDYAQIEKYALSVYESIVHSGCISKDRLAVISNVQAQSEKSPSLDNHIISSAEDLHGLEWDYIILIADISHNTNDTTRPFSPSKECNFVQNTRALYIALTRARLRFIIVSNVNCQTRDANMSSSCESWQKLVEYYRSNNLIEEEQ